MRYEKIKGNLLIKNPLVKFSKAKALQNKKSTNELRIAGSRRYPKDYSASPCIPKELDPRQSRKTFSCSDIQINP